MKKTTTVLLFILALCSSQANAQFGGLLKKKDKTTDNVTEATTAKAEDEPGTIFGNYYFKVIHGVKARPMPAYDSYNVEQSLPKKGTIAIKRVESGKDEVVMLAWGGENRSGYSYKNNVCGACAQTNAAGFVRYRALDYFDDPAKANAEAQSAWFVKGDISSFADGILSIGNIQDFDFRGLIIMSKDKSKLDAVTPENVKDLAATAHNNYKEALKNGDKGKPMPKPGNAFNAPVYAKAKAAAVAAAKTWLAGKGYTNLEPVYAYEMANGAEFAVVKDNAGNQTARQVQFFVVCKNKEIGDKNDLNTYKFKTKFIAFPTTIREDGSGTAFSGNYYATIMGFGVPILDAENAMMYK
jgi:hypothetical protein